MTKKSTMVPSKLSEQSAELAQLVDYQTGSIVSRTLIDKSAGTVTLFAFDKEQGLSEHTAPFDALLYVFDGEAQVTVAGKTTQLKTGAIILLPVGKPHSVRATTQFKMMLIMVKS